MKTSTLARLSLFLFSIFLIAGCADTDVIQEKSEDEKSGNIVFNISTPENLKTRADANQELRFTAKLYQGRYQGSNGSGIVWLQTKQGLAYNGKSTITFQVPEGDYSFVIFADYIPTGRSADSQGIYEDEYYDTSSTNENVQMLAFTTNDNSHTLLHRHCINNDNYDCFSYYTGIVNKTAEEKVLDITLTRAVAKIRVVSTTPPPADVESITFSKFYIYDTYQQVIMNAFKGKDYQDMRLGSYSLSGMSNPAENELFYFYTFATTTGENIGEISFDIKFTDGTNRTVTIPSSTIKARQNYITTVRGAFLDDEAKPQQGDIILNLDTDESFTGSQTTDVSF